MDLNKLRDEMNEFLEKTAADWDKQVELIEGDAIQKLLNLMSKLEEEYPLTAEYETDARHVWPKRWKSLHNHLLSLEEERKKNE